MVTEFTLSSVGLCLISNVSHVRTSYILQPADFPPKLINAHFSYTGAVVFPSFSEPSQQGRKAQNLKCHIQEAHNMYMYADEKEVKH